MSTTGSAGVANRTPLDTLSRQSFVHRHDIGLTANKEQIRDM